MTSHLMTQADRTCLHTATGDLQTAAGDLQTAAGDLHTRRRRPAH